VLISSMTRLRCQTVGIVKTIDFWPILDHRLAIDDN